MSYRAPVSEYRFVFDHIVGLSHVTATERYADIGDDVIDAILTECGRLSEQVLAPLQRVGDTDPTRLENGQVRTSAGFAEGYRAIQEGGWVGMTAHPESGGMGLPMAVASAANEMMSSACMALQMAPLMAQGQIEALEHHASDTLKALYLPRLVSGEWACTMNLTEPQAGSDVGALTARAEDNGDGTYAITGQKIYISWGDNDFTENVCHLVLARLPDGVPGTKGISLFMVPKRLLDENGDPGVANTLKVVSLEHKLGLHGSPTCVMQYDAATGWLVGEPHQGMKAMFTMMNNARLGVAMQGVAIAEAAMQKALEYALERRQGGPGPIADHADVRRMLATMKAEVFAARAIALDCAVAIDMAQATGLPEWQTRAALLTPIAKAFGTETGIRVADMGIQVHGGMGYVEESGVSQYLRDVRVTSIFEGTNGIQAMDLVGRKMLDNGDAMHRLCEEVHAHACDAKAAFPNLATAVWEASEALCDATEALVAKPPAERFAGAVPYLMGAARVLGAHAHLKAAMADPARVPLARFYIRRLLPDHAAQFAHASEGFDDLMSVTTDHLVA